MEVAYAEAKGWYDGTMGEGVEQVTLGAQEVAAGHEVEADVPMDKTSTSDGVKTFPYRF